MFIFNGTKKAIRIHFIDMFGFYHNDANKCVIFIQFITSLFFQTSRHCMLYKTFEQINVWIT